MNDRIKDDNLNRFSKGLYKERGMLEVAYKALWESGRGNNPISVSIPQWWLAFYPNMKGNWAQKKVIEVERHKNTGE